MDVSFLRQQIPPDKLFCGNVELIDEIYIDTEYIFCLYSVGQHLPKHMLRRTDLMDYFCKRNALLQLQ